MLVAGIPPVPFQHHNSHLISADRTPAQRRRSRARAMRDRLHPTVRHVKLQSKTMAFAVNQRVRVNLAGLMIEGVTFHAAVTDALATIMKKAGETPPVYLVELLFSFKGLKQIEVPEERIRPA
jgi:hypothetical protein